METIRDAVENIVATLQKRIGKNEAKNYAWLILNFLKNYSLSDLFLKQDEKLSDKEKSFIIKSLKRLKKYEPIQYVLGRTFFMELPFIVNKNVLIPRPETEELVEWVLNEIKSPKPIVLDIGTGSGCIACTIKKHTIEADVEAWDISQKALNIAKLNAKLNNVKVNFQCVDIFEYQHDKNQLFDIIISNPPYITEKEKKLIQPNVLNYEPHKALFVPDDKPLLFYEKIGDLSLTALKSGGQLFLEINEMFGQKIINMLKTKGFKNVELRKDISGRDRMVRGDIIIDTGR